MAIMWFVVDPPAVGDDCDLSNNVSLADIADVICDDTASDESADDDGAVYDVRPDDERNDASLEECDDAVDVAAVGMSALGNDDFMSTEETLSTLQHQPTGTKTIVTANLVVCRLKMRITLSFLQRNPIKPGT